MTLFLLSGTYHPGLSLVLVIIFGPLFWVAATTLFGNDSDGDDSFISSGSSASSSTSSESSGGSGDTANTYAWGSRPSSSGTQWFYDNHNCIKGHIDSSSDGIMRAYDSHNMMVGWYATDADRTYDSHNMLVGTGNQLGALF